MINKFKKLFIIAIILVGFIFVSGTSVAYDSGTWYSNDKNIKVTWSSSYYQESSEIRLYSGAISKYKKVSGHYKLIKKTGFGIKQSNYYGKRLKVKNQNFYIPYTGYAWYRYYFTYTTLTPLEYYTKIYRKNLLRAYGVIPK